MQAHAGGCQTSLCYRSPQFYAANFKRLRLFPRDILISGVNFNHPVDCVAQPTPIQFALRGSGFAAVSSPQVQFNQQYVAAQLSQALVPTLTANSAATTSLGCYGLSFAPMKLGNGAVLTPESSLRELFTQCDLVGIKSPSEQRDADMAALASILAMLNSTC